MSLSNEWDTFPHNSSINHLNIRWQRLDLPILYYPGCYILRLELELQIE